VRSAEVASRQSILFKTGPAQPWYEQPMTQEIAIETVRFDSHGARLTGRLYHRGGQGLPGILVTGSWMTVKEQMPAGYAPLLAEAGFAALTFDFRGFGESEGEPREVESPARKAEDLRAAARFLASHARVDRTKVGALAICASAGYAALAARGESDIRSIAMVAPWLHDQAIVRAMYGGEAGVAERLERGRAARARFEQTGQVDYVKAASNTDPSAAMYWEGDALDYYLNPRRGAVPQWGNRFALMAWPEWLAFDPIAIAGEVRVPTRLVTGDNTATPGGARQFAARMTAPHDLVSLDGTQFDFYDDPRTVRAAASAAIEHLRETL
jgi:uncharacterized protein